MTGHTTAPCLRWQTRCFPAIWQLSSQTQRQMNQRSIDCPEQILDTTKIEKNMGESGHQKIGQRGESTFNIKATSLANRINEGRVGPRIDEFVFALRTVAQLATKVAKEYGAWKWGNMDLFKEEKDRARITHVVEPSRSVRGSSSGSKDNCTAQCSGQRHTCSWWWWWRGREQRN